MFLSHTISDILSLIYQNLKGHVTWTHPIPGRNLSCVGLRHYSPRSIWNVLPVPNIWKKTQNLKLGVIWGRYMVRHSRLSAMSPFDRVHATAYSLFSTRVCFVSFPIYSELFVESRKCLPPHAYLTLLLRVTRLEFQQDLWHPKTRDSMGQRAVLFIWSYTLTVLIEHRLVRQTDGQKDAGPSTLAWGQIKSNQIYWTTKGWKPLTCC